ncbi:MAG: chromosomal replication initiator protein DnaA [Elusimicrobiaceae bacterium]|nr:chromosomal replication initiator protein DnaA [Elusimicrobiaceae bacterium]
MDNFSSSDILSSVLQQLENKIGKDLYEMWFSATTFKLDGNLLTVTVPNEYLLKTIQSRYEDTLRELFIQQNCAVSFSYVIEEVKDPVQNVLQSIQISPAPAAPVIKNNFPSRLNSIYRFDNFIESPTNRFAYNMALAVANKPGERSNNPLFIYSTPGLGKTHLLHAIGNQICQNNPNAKVLYMAAEEFVAEYVEAIPTNSTDAFRRKYRSLDCLLMDDIQFVAGKSDKVSVQEFFYTFNALFESGKQIVLSSDRTPQQLDLDERLSSRLLSGPACEIKKPYLEMRIAILNQKRDAIHFDVGDDVIAFIAEGVQTNIRELEGAFFRLSSYCNIHNIVPTIAVAKELLSDILTQEEKRLAVNVNSIKKVVAKHFKINIEDFSSRRKTQSIAWPRQIAMYLCTELTDMSLPEIGRDFNRDHSTVVHARDLVKEKVTFDPFFASLITQMITEIKSVDNA